MGLLGRLFGGSDKKDDKSSGSRAKRGRAPSIRQIAPGEPGTQQYSDGTPAELPEISIDDIEKQKTAKPSPAEGAAAIPVDFSIPGEAPPAAKTPRPAPSERSNPPASASSGGAARMPVTSFVAPPTTRRSTRSQSRQKPLGEILIQEQLANTEQVTRAIKIQEKGGKGLVGQILVNIGACHENAIAQALGRQFLISTIELDRTEFHADVKDLLAREMCQTHRLIPFEKLGRLLCVAMANCLNRKAINEIEETTKLKVKPFNCTWIEIRRAIDRIYGGAKAERRAPTAQQAGASAPPAPEEPAADKGAPSAAPEEEERRPFASPARALIEGLDDIGALDAEVVETTSRGLASKHLAERQARRAERARVMGTDKGVVGKLIAPDLDRLFPTIADQAPEVIDLRQVEDDEFAEVDLSLPEAEELAASIGEFAAQVATAPPEDAAESVAPAEEAAADAIPEAEPEPAPQAELQQVASIEEEPLLPVPAIEEPGPQVATVAAAENLAREMPPQPPRPPAPVKLDPVPVSDAEWAQMEGDYEPDPVVSWEASYSPQGPAIVRQCID